jgi:hypothetical protein
MEITVSDSNMTVLNQSAKPKQDLPKLLYTIRETAYILSVSEKSVRRFLERGLLKTSQALRTKLITRESIENFVRMTT